MTTPAARIPLLDVIVRRYDIAPAFAGICAGFEDGAWRYEQLAEHMIEWLPEFALNQREYSAIAGESARKALRTAARNVYLSEKYQRRGEVGELLLHAIIRQEFKSEPLISKIYFKDSPNDTVKGFDAVHIVRDGAELELWLGEVKFYKDIASAIREVVGELENHLSKNFLRSEFAAICNKIDPDHDQKTVIEELLDQNTSLDKIFSRLRIPVLLTYDSSTLAAHRVSDATYKAEIEKEFYDHYERFSKTGLPDKADIILILLPLNTKKLLIDMFNQKLKGLTI